MIESLLQIGHRRKMILSQSSAQSVVSLSGSAETETKRIVPHRGSASAFDPPRSSPEADPRLLKRIPTERKYTSYLQAVGREAEYWPVISLLSSTEDHAQVDRRTLADLCKMLVSSSTLVSRPGARRSTSPAAQCTQRLR